MALALCPFTPGPPGLLHHPATEGVMPGPEAASGTVLLGLILGVSAF